MRIRRPLVLLLLALLLAASFVVACSSSTGSDSTSIDAPSVTRLELRALFCRGGQACGVEQASYRLDLQSGQLTVTSCTNAPDAGSSDAGAVRADRSAVLSADALADVQKTTGR